MKNLLKKKKMITSASLKTLQIKILPLSEKFTLRSIS